MALRKFIPSGDASSGTMKLLSFPSKAHENAQLVDPGTRKIMDHEVDVDLREVYFLIMHFLSAGPCQRTCEVLSDELLKHQLLPRRYHAWYSRTGAPSGSGDDNVLSFPLNYSDLVERYPHVEQNHLVKLLKQLLLNIATPSHGLIGRKAPNAADAPTLLGTSSFSLLSHDGDRRKDQLKHPPLHMRWPHMHADQVRGLGLREIGGGFTRHHRAPSIRAACYAIAKPSTMVKKMQNIKRLRGHRNAVYCAIFDRSGRYVVTGSDDRLVKIWSMETAFCLASCRGHEGDITDLAVNSSNNLVASASNDCIIRVWRLADGLPISVLRGHSGAVTAIAFSPRPSSPYHLLSSSDDGTCRIWDVRSPTSPRIYVPRPVDAVTGRNAVPSSSTGTQSHQIFCCAFNANGTVFVTGSSDNLARVWNACKSSTEDSSQPNHEIDVLSGHENDVNYVQFSGCAVASRFSVTESSKEESTPKFRNSWFAHDNIVTCSRDGSAIIWIPKSRRSHGKAGRWTRSYHLKVPPPPMPPQPPRGGPRQRILPTPRGVNMIVWSLDNRFVLAAIMDCRICVWNAADGTLVHSLTGHTQSTYVLDVHPFNPRIAMSAGYDGKTIVWDIWEGIPIHIYEISRFKLVDGKFSPDGTSIILSDDVGQLYILNTGQGDSQKDAKYDQFFLGDYRPLIQDTHGNVLDQETQLQPYKRNLQDLLCDSGMNPYEEPYQSMYQKRRLGALGFEWKPPSIRLAAGPDFSVDPDYQLLPLADLDALVEPLPEFIDTMDWEPENEVQSDDNDSEYNIPEEYSTGGELGSLNSGSSSDPECNAEDSDVEGKDGFSKLIRKKQKAETELMTSSGRRVKRRNLDECDGNSFSNNRVRKSKMSRKASRRRSSVSKVLRPQRVAARNALSLFSKLTGTGTDGEDEDGSGDEIAESESVIEDSNSETDDSDGFLQNEENKNSKGKEVLLEAHDDVRSRECPESHTNAGNKKRLLLKLPAWNSNKLILSESEVYKSDNRAKGPQASELNGDAINSQDPGYSSAHADSGMLEARLRGTVGNYHLDLSEGYKNGDIRWGGVKARTSKRQRLGESMFQTICPKSGIFHDNHKEKEDILNRSSELQNGRGNKVGEGMPRDGRESGLCRGNQTEKEDIPNLSSELQNGHGNNVGEGTPMGGRDTGVETSGAANNVDKGEEHPCLGGHWDVNPTEVKDELTLVSTESRIQSKKILEEPLGSQVNGEGAFYGLADARQNPMHHGGSDITSPVHKGDGLQESGPTDESSRPTLDDPSVPRSQPKKMYDNVYRRSKSSRDRANLEGDGGIGQNTSNAINCNLSSKGDFLEGTSNTARRTRSMGLKAPDLIVVSNNLRSGQRDEQEGIYRDANSSSAPVGQLPSQDWGSSSRATVGLRSTRSRRTSYDSHDTSPIHRKKLHRSSEGGSWLMLSMHEEGSRYIPQLGDEVVYLRQGHNEYLEYIRSKEAGPWKSVKGNIRAVEFCKVESLKYDYLPGSGESCCRMVLKFVDPTSDVFQKSFKLTLPEVTAFPDFLVERSRFDAAMERNWSGRDKCKVWWKNEGEEAGSWWEGRIVAVKPKASEFPDSPWERYTIRYKGNPGEILLHSPWELFDEHVQWGQPHIADETRKKLLSSFDELEQPGKRVKDKYGVEKLNQVSLRDNFKNSFPVPLSPEVIQERLENNYYRNLEAVKHDFDILVSNAQSYFVKNAETLTKIRRLSDWFGRTWSSL